MGVTPVDRIYPLAEAAEAVRHLGCAAGKIVDHLTTARAELW